MAKTYRYKPKLPLVQFVILLTILGYALANVVPEAIYASQARTLKWVVQSPDQSFEVRPELDDIKGFWDEIYKACK
jgi:hypothetical protein